MKVVTKFKWWVVTPFNVKVVNSAGGKYCVLSVLVHILAVNIIFGKQFIQEKAKTGSF